MTSRTVSLLLLVSLIGCVPAPGDDADDTEPGETDDTEAEETDDTEPGETDDTEPEDTDLPKCDPPTSVIPGVTASSPGLDTCCSGGFAALTDGSGLSGTGDPVHDCDDGTTYKSAVGNTSGAIDFDLGDVWRVDTFTIWPSGQLDGDRAPRDVSLATSLDGTTWTPVPGGPSELAQPTCPAEPQTFVLHGTRARHVRLEVASLWGDAANLGIGEVAFGGVRDCGLTEIEGVSASAPEMGTCCSGGFAAMLDGSGLDVDGPAGVHSCDDADLWSANSTGEPSATSGDLVFDLGATYRLAEIAVWNSAQTSGGRGVDGVEIATSVDGSTYVVVPSAPSSLDLRPTCPSPAQFVRVAPSVEARFVRFAIQGHHGGGATTVGLGEVKFYAEAP